MARIISAPSALPPLIENYGKGLERQSIYLTPDYQAKLRVISQLNGLNALKMQATDPEREFVTDLCWNGNDGCAGDVRLYDWQTKGYGIVQPVLFTARNGATLSGHVWATEAGPSKRPGIVITNGSVQADEQWDPRVKAIVAWDDLAKPDPNQSTGASGGGPEEKGCVDPSQRTVPPITKPAPGLSADYFIPPEPNTSDPDPLAKSTESLEYSKLGVDTGEIVIRGGTHYDFSFIPDPAFTASLRGADEIAWYTTA